MWILVVGDSENVERREGGFAELRDLGCRVRAACYEDAFDTLDLRELPPAAVLIEALEDLSVARNVLARLRAVPEIANAPVLVALPLRLTSRLDGTDGFDDFVTVPYVAQELYVRLRRADWRRGEFVGHEVIKIGPLELDLAGDEVTLDGRRVELTRQEFALLSFLCQNRGRVFSRDQLLSRVWGASHYRNTRTIDMHMRRLRTKLTGGAVPLETVRGVGYVMRPV